MSDEYRIEIAWTEFARLEHEEWLVGGYSAEVYREGRRLFPVYGRTPEAAEAAAREWVRKDIAERRRREASRRTVIIKADDA